MRPCVFIHTNQKQNLGALVSAYSLTRKSRHADRFDVKIIRAEDHSFLAAREGQRFLRGGERRVWTMNDLQSFTPLRFLPPALMSYQGRAVIIDPDIFAVGDIWELLNRDMQGRAIFARPRPGYNGNPDYIATSVMLLECSKLQHWKCERDFGELFEFKRDYLKWTQLGYESRETIGVLEPGWNDFDHLDENTKLLHNTKRRTQPWKTGLPVDFTMRRRFFGLLPGNWLTRIAPIPAVTSYRPHPDPNQERYFFSLLRECLDRGVIDEATVRDEMKRQNVRPDAFDVLERISQLAA